MLMNSAVYKNGLKVADTDAESLKEYAFNEGEFAWAAFHDPEPGEIESLCLKLGVHDLVLEDIRHGEQMPKVEEYEDNLFIVMKQFAVDGQEIQVGDLYLLVGPNYVVTVRKGVGRGLEATRKTVERDSKLLNLGSGYVAYAIMDAIVDRYFPIVSQFEREIDTLENEIFDDTKKMDKSTCIKKLHNVKDRVRQIRGSILPLLDNVRRLFGGRVPEVCDGLDNYYRDTHDHLLRICSNLDSLLETATGNIQTSVALITIDENKVTKKLASWAAMFATVTFMAGIWGMNFKFMPETDWKYGYYVALGSMFTVALSIRFHFKRKGWL